MKEIANFLWKRVTKARATTLDYRGGVSEKVFLRMPLLRNM